MSTLHRFNDNPDRPSNDVNHLEFAEDEYSVEHYGDVHWVVDDAELTLIREIEDKIREQFAVDLANNRLSPELESIGIGILDDLDPDKIVDSAGAWDCCEFVAWVWDRVLDAAEIKGVQTQDGAVVFDTSIVRRA